MALPLMATGVSTEMPSYPDGKDRYGRPIVSPWGAVGFWLVAGFVALALVGIIGQLLGWWV